MQGFLKNIYHYSPIWFQNIIITLYGFKIFKMRYGRTYYENYNKLIVKSYSDLESEKEFQNNELKKFIRYVVENSPFYNNLYADVDINDINTVEDLKKLPIVNKEMLRSNIENVYTINKKEGIASFTGGTTGKSLKVLYTFEDFQKRMAYLDAFKFRVGIKDPFKVKKATFSGRELTTSPKFNVFWRHNFMYNQRLYSTFDINDTNLPCYIENLNKFKPQVINGFVSSIFDVASYIVRNKIKLSFTPIAIFTTSETLLSSYREVIEKAFNTKIYNQYASAEGAPFITECSAGSLHYNLDTGVIEVNRENEMIVTSFTTRGTPLIRYNIGDIITFMEGNCSCGSSHPLVKCIEGRKLDYLFSKTRGKISLSHLADVIKGVPNSIKKMQFIQNTLDRIDIKIVIDRSIYSNDDEKKIYKEMLYRFGEGTKINILVVEDIPNEKSGKYSLIKNNCQIKTNT